MGAAVKFQPELLQGSRYRRPLGSTRQQHIDLAEIDGGRARERVRYPGNLAIALDRRPVVSPCKGRFPPWAVGRHDRSHDL